MNRMIDRNTFYDAVCMCADKHDCAATIIKNFIIVHYICGARGLMAWYA